MISSGQKVVAAVSGGCDSVCMLHILSKLAGTIGFSLEAAHFNHKLRQEESERDEQFTKNLCEKLEIPLHVGAGDVSGYAARSAVGIEEAARILRYEFLEKISEETGADRIATAHNADDNAETVLFNLTRGSGIKGLCGIPPVRGKIIRPVMFLTRTRIEQYMEENGLDHVEDSTNADTDYTRNKLRHNVMPVLRRINPNVSGSIMDTKQLLTWDDEFISAFAQRFIDGNFNNGCVSAADIAGQLAQMQDHPGPVTEKDGFQCFTGEPRSKISSGEALTRVRATPDLMLIIVSQDPRNLGAEKVFQSLVPLTPDAKKLLERP